MIDLSNVKVTGKMLLAWQKQTSKDPVMLDKLTFKDILYAYYIMAKEVNPEITEDQAYAEIEGKEMHER